MTGENDTGRGKPGKRNVRKGKGTEWGREEGRKTLNLKTDFRFYESWPFPSSPWHVSRCPVSLRGASCVSWFCAERRAVRVVRRRRARWPLFGLRLSILGGQVVALSDPAAMRLVLPAQEAGD